MLVACYSSQSGQIATTSNAIALALILSLEHERKVLITHTHFSNFDMENALFEKEDEDRELRLLDDTGFDGLIRNLEKRIDTKKELNQYTKPIIKNKLDFLEGTNNANKDLFNSDFNNKIFEILSTIHNLYDDVIIDVGGNNESVSKAVLDRCDLVVINLNQNTNGLGYFFEKVYPNIKEKCYILITLYDKESKFNLKKIKRMYKVDKNIAKISYNRAFADAFNQGNITQFILRNIDARKEDFNYKFIQDLKECGQAIVHH